VNFDTYRTYLEQVCNMGNLLSPLAELDLLAHTPDPWACVIQALIMGHIAHHRPYLTADYLLGKLAQCRGLHPESLLDEENRRTYELLRAKAQGGEQ
jgi:hypothetical protein